MANRKKKPTKPTHDQTRPPLFRMLQIHHALQQAKYPNCSSLAKELGATPRTLARDLEFMRYSLDLPIDWDVAKNGYYYTETVVQFPLLPLSQREIFALAAAQKTLIQYQGTPLQQPLEAAFRKLLSQLDDQETMTVAGIEDILSFRVSAPDDSDLQVFEVLAEAVRDRRVVKLSYRTRATMAPKQRDIHPYHLHSSDNHWYLFAFDLLRNQVIKFKLNRVQKAELTAATFKKKKFDPKALLKKSFGVFTSEADADYEVVIDFDPFAADEVRDRRWHVSWDATELPKGWLRLRLRLANLVEVERWILSFGDHAEVVAPQALKDSLAAKAQWYQRAYGKPQPNGAPGSLPICDGCLGQAKHPATAASRPK